MDMTRGLQEVVSRNVRVLMAVHDITHQKDLAARLNWGADKLTRTLNGTRRWSLDDLADLARVFGVTPAALLGTTTDLVGASHPTPMAVSQGISPRYCATDASIILFPQVRPNLDRPLRRPLTRPAQIITLGRHPRFRTDLPPSSTSPTTPTGVTTAVGL